ncbi:MAG TPA: Spy/CpxP family protein refolding chaperone, partial [Mycobacterium sp.]|nr:Spy/CpxP family protein refolding chaperone [Mycobacterium sp.]
MLATIVVLGLVHVALANPVPPWIDHMTKGLDLTAAQKAQLEAVKNELSPQAPPINQRLQEAVKQLDAARNAWASGRAWAPLAEQGQQQLDEAKKAAAALEREVHDRVMAVLTAEQKAHVGAQEAGGSANATAGANDMLARHDFVMAGEMQNVIYLVKDGKV